MSKSAGPQATNKECVVLDLRSTEGKATLDAMLSSADVLVENFRPGRLAEMGAHAELLKKDDGKYAALFRRQQEMA